MVFKYLSLVTGFCYIVLGLIIIFYKASFANFNPTMILVFGIAIILYGIFRIWRGFLNLKNTTDEE